VLRPPLKVLLFYVLVLMRSRDSESGQLNSAWVGGCVGSKPSSRLCYRPQEEARRAILSEYDRWAKTPPRRHNDGRLSVLPYLQNERTDLLDFRASDNDKWQIVHGWLRDWVED
jgi:hypothetical protein